MQYTILAICGFTCFVQPSVAAVILTRAALNAATSGSAVSENFEAWMGEVSNYIGPTLSNSTIVEGQGPGLVVGGVVFTNENTNVLVDDIQWDRRAGYNLTSGVILAEGGTLRVDFLNFTTHFGVDLLQFNGFTDSDIITVYAADDVTPLFSSIGVAPNAPSFTFFGYENAAGIGSVRLRSGTNPWSPLIDNLTFAAAAVTLAPEPSKTLLLTFGAAACLARRRRGVIAKAD